ncbi:hypothetical protein SS50377_22497 [Spironucleus salmonicida]|uniref:Uncharacterized protein n=1 Tax=Spironucleus salmonicida TaxID=348837 RepID=V6LC18_9EUKA|nr:hypothetical protein SS50377_22497 [Spironucleus salmonicida]|eukprot:EST42012.1 Hypothetical protein SS50377_18318 [Spironucleus salmonicida]
MNLSKCIYKQICQEASYQVLTFAQKTVLDAILTMETPIFILALPGAGTSHLMQCISNIGRAVYANEFQIFQEQNNIQNCQFLLVEDSHLYSLNILQLPIKHASNVVLAGLYNQDIMKFIRQRGISICVLEHNMKHLSRNIFMLQRALSRLDQSDLQYMFEEFQEKIEPVTYQISNIVEIYLNVQDRRDYFRNKDAVFQHKHDFQGRLKNYNLFYKSQQQEVIIEFPPIVLVEKYIDAEKFHSQLIQAAEGVIKIENYIFWPQSLIIFNQNHKDIQIYEIGLITNIVEIQGRYQFIIVIKNRNNLYLVDIIPNIQNIPFELAFALSIDRYNFLKLDRAIIQIVRDSSQQFILQCISMAQQIQLAVLQAPIFSNTRVNFFNLSNQVLNSLYSQKNLVIPEFLSQNPFITTYYREKKDLYNQYKQELQFHQPNPPSFEKFYVRQAHSQSPVLFGGIYTGYPATHQYHIHSLQESLQSHINQNFPLQNLYDEISISSSKSDFL